MRRLLGVALLAIAATGCTPRATPPATTTPAAGATSSTPLFSEDFESGKLDPAVWSQQITGDNLIQVQPQNAAHGKYALQVRCPAAANKTWAFILTNKLPAALRDHHFGRASIFISPQVPARHTIFLMAGTPDFPTNAFQEIATANGRWQLTWVDLHPAGEREDYHAGDPLPTGRWVCLEWEFGATPSHTTTWVDGVPSMDIGFVSKATGKSQTLAGGFTQYGFGFRLWGAAPAAFDIYFDDIALDTQRIGPVKDAR